MIEFHCYLFLSPNWHSSRFEMFYKTVQVKRLATQLTFARIESHKVASSEVDLSRDHVCVESLFHLEGEPFLVGTAA